MKRAGQERVEDLLGDLAPGGESHVPVGVTELLRGVPDGFDRYVLVADRERGLQPRVLPIGEVLPSRAEDIAGPAKRIAT